MHGSVRGSHIGIGIGIGIGIRIGAVVIGRGSSISCDWRSGSGIGIDMRW